MPKKADKFDGKFLRTSYALTLVLIVLIVAAVLYVNSITGFLTIPTIYERASPLVSYYGGSAKIDGYATKGEWNDAGFVTMPYEGGTVKIASKHDLKYFYFLLQWQDENPSWDYAPHFYFEQDDFAHDHVLDGKNDYFFAMDGAYCINPGSAGAWDGYYENWIPRGVDFDRACSYSQASREWTVETRLPLSNYLYKNIMPQITNFKKSYNLGFAIINWQNNVPGGFAAQSWNWPYDQKITSAGAYTVDEDTDTWGDLNIVWARKPAK